MKHRHLLLSTLCSSLLIAGGDIAPAPVEPIIQTAQEEVSAWSYELEPYLFVSSMTGPAKIGRTPTLEIDMDFGSILENLDMGAMVHFEAHNTNGWGYWLDYGFMDLSSDITGPVGGVTNARVRQGILEAFALYRQPLANGHFDYLAGIRWWDNDFDVKHNTLPVDVKIDESWVDPVIGGRWTTNINESWIFSLHGSIGGFGVSSELTASGAVALRYVINDLVDLDLQYKALWADYESGTRGTQDYFSYDVTTHGPVVGVIFKF
ncbi:hypothetical protein [Sulfurovum sp.]|uniref:hypothetical protein n=1 Tax=Sulfurovum sp. TaxID=1969726 RepID=UPI0028681A07|nr:hypothetical protein [Sulfurovum sp.]